MLKDTLLASDCVLPSSKMLEKEEIGNSEVLGSGHDPSEVVAVNHIICRTQVSDQSQTLH